VPKIVAGSAAVAKPRVEAHERHAICIKDWVCFDTSADCFWNLNSFTMGEALVYVLSRGKTIEGVGSMAWRPIKNSVIFWENT
jgi:hypothetical protein